MLQMTLNFTYHSQLLFFLATSLFLKLLIQMFPTGSLPIFSHLIINPSKIDCSCHWPSAATLDLSTTLLLFVDQTMSRVYLLTLLATLVSSLIKVFLFSTHFIYFEILLHHLQRILNFMDPTTAFTKLLRLSFTLKLITTTLSS